MKYGLAGKRRNAKGKVCVTCRKDKPESEFSRDSRRPDGLRICCRTCKRAQDAAYRESPDYLAMRDRNRDGVRERDRERNADPDRRAGKNARDHVYKTTARGRVVNCLNSYRSRLRRATDPNQAARLQRLIDLYEAEFARMDRQSRLDETEAA